MQPGTDHEQDRRRIIDAAYHCLSEPHPGPISVSQILHRAGVSSRAFYRHFETKDDLFLALLQDECDALAARVDRVADEAVGCPTDQLAAWIGEMFDMCTDPRQRMHLAVVDSHEVRAARGYRETRGRSHTQRERSLTEILGRGRADGSFPLTEPGTDAAAISAVVARVLAEQPIDDPEAIEKGLDRVLDFALRAVGAIARP